MTSIQLNVDNPKWVRDRLREARDLRRSLSCGGDWSGCLKGASHRLLSFRERHRIAPYSFISPSPFLSHPVLSSLCPKVWRTPLLPSAPSCPTNWACGMLPVAHTCLTIFAHILQECHEGRSLPGKRVDVSKPSGIHTSHGRNCSPSSAPGSAARFPAR